MLPVALFTASVGVYFLFLRLAKEDDIASSIVLIILHLILLVGVLNNYSSMEVALRKKNVTINTNKVLPEVKK